MHRSILVIAMILLTFMMVSCSKLPETEIGDAKSALEQAMTVEADQYAGESFQKAIDAMNAAKVAKEEQDAKFSLFRKYDKVREMYVSAQQLADQAKSEAETEKERVKSEVATLVFGVQSAIDTAARSLEVAPVGKGSRVEIEVYRSTLNSIQEALAKVQLDVEQGKYLVAKPKLEALLNRATAISNEIEKAQVKKTS